MSTDWKVGAQAYKDSVISQIKPEWRLPASLLPLPYNVMSLIPSSGLLSTRQLEILSLDATALRDAVVGRTYKAIEVAEAYCIAAGVIHQATNCLMEFFPHEALDRARWLDEEYERSGRPVGAMHGVPVTVKDIITVRGKRNTMGFLSKIQTYDNDAPIVAALRAAGAVFYCKTTCPQAVMHLESDSFLGPTLNPYDTRLTAGGSSGGESAILAAGASPIGIGTDIGGSIRSPAALCGIYGFKPTVGRLPISGAFSPMTGQQSITGTSGPMARSSRDLGLFMSAILDQRPWEMDQTCVRMPWRPDDVVFCGGTLPRVGVMRDDGVVMPVPPMRRALRVVSERLKRAGMELVEVDPKAFDWKESWEIARRAYFTDGGKRVRDAAAAGGEPLLPLTEWILNQGPGELSASEIIDLSNRRSAHQAAYHAWFASLNIDVFLCPPAPGPAPELSTSQYWGYTSMFNVLDIPAGVFPTGLAVEESDTEEKREYWSESDKEVWEAYSPHKFLGLPLALQVAGRKWEDEKVVKALEIMDEIVHRP